jgi:hypothetical protein
MNRLASLIIAACGLTWLPGVQAQDRDKSGLFEPPQERQTLSIPADPKAQTGPGTLRCFYYPRRMIKELSQDGDKGAALLSITGLQKGQARPACQLARAEGEKTIADWDGYFWGVKGDYLFFGGADGDGGGLPFAVYASTGSRLFVDVNVAWHSIELTMPVRDRDARPWYENPLELRFRRSYLAPCSLRAGEKACWRAIRRLTGLPPAAPPGCRAAYQADERANPAQAALARLTPSYIDYDARAVLDGRGVIRVTPVGPAGKCYPAP